MIQQIFRRSRWLLPLLGVLTFGLMAPAAMADRGDRGHGRNYGNYHQHYKHQHQHHKGHHRKHGYYRAPRRVKVVEHHYYREPSYHHSYRGHGSPGASISVILPLGTIVHGLPGGYVSFNLGGDPYYYHGGNYYRPYRRGYEVISAPRGHRW